MSDHLPRWVRQSDGRLTPFDPDQVHRALFAASERLGQPDPFLARELTDSVLHFLAGESDQAFRSEQIHELVVKVVRELGQPALAQAFDQLPANGPPGANTPGSPRIEVCQDPLELARELAAPALRDYSLRSVYGPELAAAHRDGLLILTGLEHPGELAASTLDGWSALPEAILQARFQVGQVLVLDAPEYRPGESGDPAMLARELAWGLRASGLHAVVNLNLASPPRWAEQAAEGPLFAGQTRPRERRELDGLADRWLEALATVERARVDWHLGERDFQADQAARLLRVARRVADGQGLALVFDRPRQATALAEGIDRRHPAVLLFAGLNLPTLAARVGGGDADLFLRKLGSLARLAISAAAQKRDYLRRQRPALNSGFLLDRARLVVTPVGLETTARPYHDQRLGDDAASLELARRMVQELRDVLQRECGGRQLESSVDSPAVSLLEGQDAGLTPKDAQPAFRQQLRAAGVLHGVCSSGTARLALPAERRVSGEELADLLRYAWRHTEIVRLVVRRHNPETTTSLGLIRT